MMFSILVLTHAVTTFAGLAIFFQIAFAVNGLIEIGFVQINRRSLRGWGWHLAGGIIDLAAAILLVNPVLAVVTLPVFAGGWLLFRSIAIIARSSLLAPTAPGQKGWMIMWGFAGLVFASFILYTPTSSVLPLLTWTGLGLLVIGIFYISLGFYLRDAQGRMEG
jgi:uncharacterized membrane protein HdeD (DUF308 family)